MQAAADDLAIELIVKCGRDSSTYITKKKGNELINSEPKLDYLLTSYWQAVTEDHLVLTKERDIKVFMFSADVVAEERDKVGRPRQRYSNWIGQMVPDDRKAGEELAALLIARAHQAKLQAPDGKIHVVGLGGGDANDVADRRNEGLRSQAGSNPDVLLREIVPAFWRRQSAYRSTLELLRKYPDTGVIWAASDAMAWGAIEAVEQMNKTAGKDVFIGGFDWLAASLPRLEDARMAASMGGQLLEGVWALILVHDYHYGFDFADDTGVRILTPMYSITVDNVERYKAIFDDNHWEDVDFRQHSKKYNPDLKAYDFNFAQFLD